jgi:hypothetical protein
MDPLILSLESRRMHSSHLTLLIGSRLNNHCHCADKLFEAMQQQVVGDAHRMEIAVFIS